MFDLANFGSIESDTYSYTRDSQNRVSKAKPTKSAIATLQTYSIIEKIKSLQSLQTNWDNNGAPTISPSSVAKATSLIQEIYNVTIEAGIWLKPNVTANNYGEIVFEWWNQERKLTVYVDETTTWFVKVWGQNIDEEMDDGSFDDNYSISEVMSWLGGN